MGETGNTVIPVQPGCSRALSKARAVRPEEDRTGKKLWIGYNARELTHCAHVLNLHESKDELKSI